MKNITDRPSKGFRITKWFLDFIGEDGSILIVYAATLEWKGGLIPYTNILWHRPGSGLSKRYRFSRVRLPEREGNHITWTDKRFKIAGVWEAVADPLNARLYESGNQVLDWQCWQPRSKVSLITGDATLEGEGYAEVISTTFSTWEIPLRELRWGHMFSGDDWAVWIELRGNKQSQWIWWNGEKKDGCLLSDTELFFPDPGVTLKLDGGLILEKEQKVNRVAGRLVGFIPGFSKILPKAFLMAHQTMWASRIQLAMEGREGLSGGRAIHEFLNANPK